MPLDFRHGFGKRLGQHIEGLRQRQIEHEAESHGEHGTDQQHPVPGMLGAQQRSQAQGTRDHQKGDGIAHDPHGQPGQQAASDDRCSILEPTPQQHKAAGSGTQPEQQRQYRADDHHQGGLHTTAHDETC